MNSSEARKRFTEWMNDPAAADAITKEGSIDASWIGFWKGWKASLAAAPTPQAQDGMVEVIREDADNYCRILSLLGMEEEGDPVAEIERLLSAPPAQEDEPIFHTNNVCLISEWMDEVVVRREKDSQHNIPLYTRPDNSGLRKAAEEAIDALTAVHYGGECPDAKYHVVADRLRAALEGK